MKAYIFSINMLSMKTAIGILWKLLSQDEKKKVIKFSTPLLKERYIVSHGILRIFLSFFCQSSPQDVRFEFNQYGKPYLLNEPLIHFNLSHSEEFAAYIFGFESEVGIDIEYKKHNLNFDEIAQQVFTPLEKERLVHLSTNEKVDAFYDILTKKEAIVKAMGKGFSYPLKSIEVINSLTSAACHVVNADTFFYNSFTSFEKIAGSIAIKNHSPELRYRVFYHYSELSSFIDHCNCKRDFISQEMRRGPF